MVFSEAGVVSAGRGHEGDITGGDPNAIGSVIGGSIERDDIEVT